jgi:hypothetical protein
LDTGRAAGAWHFIVPLFKGARREASNGSILDCRFEREAGEPIPWIH